MRRTWIMVLLLGAVLVGRPEWSSGQTFTQRSDFSEAVDRLFSNIDPAGPGCAVAVTIGDRTVHQSGYGMADLSHGVPATPQTVFKVASITKQFVGTAVAILEAEGSLSVQDPVRSYLPELPEYLDPVTLDHLLHHTSGVRDAVSVTLLSGRDLLTPHTRGDVLELVRRQSGLNLDPGTDMLYSNSGYFLLDEILARRSGRSTAAFLEERLFQPLGMSRTRLLDRPEPVPGLATEYEVAAEGVWAPVASRRISFGSGNAVSTVEDLARWGAELNRMAGGGSTLVPSILRPVQLEDGRTLPYGFGIWDTPYGSQRGIYHSGSTGYGFVSNAVALPDHDAFVAVLCNGAVVATGQALFALANLVANDEGPESVRPLTAVVPEPTTGATAEWVRQTGRYVVGEQRFVLAVENDRVSMRPDRPTGGGSAIGVPTSDSTVTFRTQGVTLSISNDLSNPLSYWSGGTVEPARRVDDAGVPEEELERIIGLYWSQDLDAALRVRRTGSDGVELVAGLVETRLLREEPLRYSSSDGALRFEVGEDGGVTGLVIDTGRSIGITARRVGR